MGAVGAMASLGATLLQVNQISEEGKLKEGELKENKELAYRAAADAIYRGHAEAGKSRLKGSQLAAKQQVAYAASGVDTTVGTPVDTIADSRLFSELDALTIENNAAREAWGYKKQAESFDRQAALDRQKRKYATAGTLLGGAGRFASLFPEG